MKRNIFTKLTVLSLGAFLIVSCGGEKVPLVKNSSSVNMSAKEFAAPKMLSARASNAVFMDSVNVTEEAVYENDSASMDENGASSPLERKIIRNGNVSLEVESLEEAEKRIGEWATKFGGYITSSWESESSSSYTVKIPSEKFDEAFNETKNYGKFLNGNINSDDITDQYYDLETRLEAKKVLRERLENYLKNAKETKELLNIEKELNNAVSEIESMEGRMRRMKNQVAYSTININLQLPYRVTSEGFEWPSFTSGLRIFAVNVLDFFIGLFKVICYVLICGLPLFALVVLFYWLFFGKIGLIKKLFKKLK